jgi:Ca2+/H+ antiporter
MLNMYMLRVAAACCACRYLCSSIEEFSTNTGLSQAFLGMIVLPIAGNACEHITGGCSCALCAGLMPAAVAATVCVLPPALAAMLGYDGAGA